MPPHDSLFEGPVEFVFGNLERFSSFTTSSPSSPAKDEQGEQDSVPPQRERRVSISEDSNQVYEICKADKDLKNDLWYNEGEYRRFLVEAGYKEPPLTTTRSTSPLLCISPWVVRGLWLGSIVMGVLATSTTMATKRAR